MSSGLFADSSQSIRPKAESSPYRFIVFGSFWFSFLITNKLSVEFRIFFVFSKLKFFDIEVYGKLTLITFLSSESSLVCPPLFTVKIRIKRSK